MSEQHRRDPDELLSAIKHHEANSRRGRLKVFFGAAAGVGKTYSMLEAARTARAAGIDVVIGYIEPHGRLETERLAADLERLPLLEVEYRNIIRLEFNLDAGLERRPAILVVDELAHSNVIGGEPPQRHAKRWQDIDELLDAGICVWTTLNVQHLESLNDVVAGITGVQQRETIPDRVFDQASDVELIDLSPGDLLERLRAGKVYSAAHASAATKRYFREPNLLALRELALRRTADRVDAAARAYKDEERFSQPWLARDRFLVAVDLGDQAEQLIRVGKRFADALDAEWVVVSVETPRMLRLGETARNRRVEILRLADSLGAQTVTLDGPSASAALVEYANLRNITRIVVGEPRRTGLGALFKPATATKLVQARGGADVSVIARRKAPVKGEAPPDLARPHEIKWRRYVWALAISVACTLLAAAIFPYVSLTNLVMVYLLGATIAALRLGRGPASCVAVLNTCVFDFFFVPPRFSFAVADAQYVITFAVMLTVALIIATLVANVRAQTRVAGARERRTALLYAMSRELAATRTLEDLAHVAVKHVAETFASRAVVLVPDPDSRLHSPRGAPVHTSLRGADLSVAQWVYDHGSPAGLGTDTLPAASAQYLPLKGTLRSRGVLAVEPTQRRRLLLPEQRHLLETFAAQIAIALERASLQDEAEQSRVAAHAEQLRNTLLASISHDLRTPLSVITGASSALNDPTMTFDAEARRLLTAQIEGKSKEMAAIVSNVLDLMRFESGGLTLRLEPVAIDELVNAALARLKERLALHPVEVSLPADLPLVNVDSALMLQVLINLLENAAKHTPAGTRVGISASSEERFVDLIVEDAGPGLPAGGAERLFAKFQRGREESGPGGAGLGLAICRAIVSAHGGRIEAGERVGGGAKFVVRLPVL
jgi:two-component system, OmpR family, sensor histidine kinase KdpD